MPRKRNTVEDYRRCAEAGMTAIETARHLGVHRDTVGAMKARYGIPFRRQRASGSRVKGPDRRGGSVWFDKKLHATIADMATTYRVSFSEMVCILCDKSLEVFAANPKQKEEQHG